MCVRDGTHPTGMHSCFKARKHSSRIRNTWLPPVCVSVAASRCQYWEGCRWVYLSHDTHPHSPLGYPPPPCGLPTPMINASLWHTCLSLAYLPLSGIPVPSGIPALAYPSFGIHPPQKGHETRDSHPPKGHGTRYTTPQKGPGTRDTSPQKGYGTRDTPRRDLRPDIPTPVIDRQTPVKYYLSETTVAGSN